MKDNNVWRNKNTFILFYLIVNVVFLTELLPSLGISVLGFFSSRKIIVVLIFVSCLILCRNHIIYKNRISSVFFIMNLYFLIVTMVDSSIQQQPFYYYFAAVLYPWTITYIAEILLGKINGDGYIEKIANFVASFAFIYMVLMIWYKFGVSSLLTASGEASIYFIITLLPFVLCCKGRFRNVMLVLFVLAVFITLKRTALIAIALSLCAYLLVRFKNHDEKKFRIVLYAIAGVVLFLVVYQIVVKYTGNDLIEKLINSKEDGGSNREFIYNRVIETFKDMRLEKKVFGIGYNGVRYDYNIVSAGTVVSAHNDFLEVLCDYGIVGIILYMGFIVKIIKDYLMLRKSESEYAASMAAAIVLFFVLSFFSHLILYTSYFMNLLIFFVMMESVILKENDYKEVPEINGF